jgi:hypothetical protein
MTSERIRNLRRCLTVIHHLETAHAPTTAKKGLDMDDELADRDRLAALPKDEDKTPLQGALEVLVDILKLPSYELGVVRDIMRCIDSLQPAEPKLSLSEMVYGDPDKLDPNWDMGRQVDGADIIKEGR